MREGLQLPKGLQAALCMAVATSAIALLVVEPLQVDLPPGTPDTPGAPDKRENRPGHSEAERPRWLRDPSPDAQTPDVSAPVKEEPTVLAAPPPSAEPKPVAPDPALTFAYLGRMQDQGRELAFVAHDSVPQVVERGALLSPEWRVVRIEATQLRLMFLPLREVSVLPATAVLSPTP